MLSRLGLALSHSQNSHSYAKQTEPRQHGAVPARKENPPVRIGVDAGGTFTDFVILHDDGRLESFKLRSNPAAPAAVILAGIDRATGGGRAEVVHGSTVATNALLERKGARTAFVTTDGFADLVFIGRQDRPQLYNLTPRLRRPLVVGS